MRTLFVGLLATVSLSGCVSLSTTHRMDLNDLRRFTVDCSNKEAQIRFLETQIVTPRESALVAMEMTSLLGVINAANQGVLTQKRDMNDRLYNSVARRLIWEIRDQCNVQTDYLTRPSAHNRFGQ